MEFVSRYVAHQPDQFGIIKYTAEEHRIWQILFERQSILLPGRACDEFLQGLRSLGLTSENIPQLVDVSRQLKKMTGWQVVPVSALISARAFFELLADRCFPAATFIRCEEELVYADFVHNYALKVLSFPESDWPLLQRLFWFTVEFGLMNTSKGLRAYGGGILSSISETVYSVESNLAMRVIFDPVVAFRTPYRIDMLQPVYFVIDDYHKLYDFVTSNIGELIQQARSLGEYPPFFPVDADNPNIHIYAC